MQFFFKRSGPQCFVIGVGLGLCDLAPEPEMKVADVEIESSVPLGNKKMTWFRWWGP